MNCTHDRKIVEHFEAHSGADLTLCADCGAEIDDCPGCGQPETRPQWVYDRETGSNYLCLHPYHATGRN